MSFNKKKEPTIKWILPLHSAEIKEREKMNKYLDLARELWNLKLIVIPIVVNALGTAPKAWKKDWMNWKSEEELIPSRLQHC